MIIINCLYFFKLQTTIATVFSSIFKFSKSQKERILIEIIFPLVSFYFSFFSPNSTTNQFVAKITMSAEKSITHCAWHFHRSYWACVLFWFPRVSIVSVVGVESVCVFVRTHSPNSDEHVSDLMKTDTHPKPNVDCCTAMEKYAHTYRLMMNTHSSAHFGRGKHKNTNTQSVRKHFHSPTACLWCGRRRTTATHCWKWSRSPRFHPKAGCCWLMNGIFSSLKAFVGKTWAT